MIFKIKYLDKIDIPQIYKNKKEVISLEQHRAIEEKNAPKEGITKETDDNTTKAKIIIKH